MNNMGPCMNNMGPGGPPHMKGPMPPNVDNSMRMMPGMNLGSNPMMQQSNMMPSISDFEDPLSYGPQHSLAGLSIINFHSSISHFRNFDHCCNLL